MEEIFLIVNPKSGGNKGEAFLKAPQPFVIDLDDGRHFSLRIFSILDGESGRKPGFQALKQRIQICPYPVKVIVGGGDGTVMFADSECEKHGIDTKTKVVFGIVPLGTGNDFARSYGWGGKNPEKILDEDCKVLRDLAKKWAMAKECKHDVWQVQLRVSDSQGVVMKVGHDKEEEAQAEKVVAAPMVNYFSIGQESRAGIDFDKHRTKSQFANLLVYGLAGAFAELNCMQRWNHIGSVIGSLHHGTGPDGEIIFNQDREDEFPDLVGNPESLMFLNINSYAGGNCRFWRTENAIGLDPEPEDHEVEVEQDPGDGRLEVVTVPSLVAIGLDKAVHMSKRITSAGPYYIKFGDDDDTPDELEAWCEIDGEFYHLVNPDSALVTHKKCLQVLRNMAPEA